MPKLKIALGFAATFTAGVVLATTAQARDLAVVSWGGAYQDAQKEGLFRAVQEGDRRSDERRVVGRRHRCAARQGWQGGAATWDVRPGRERGTGGWLRGRPVREDRVHEIGGEAAYLPPTVNSCGVGAIVYDFVLGYDKDKLKDGPKAGPTSSTPRSIREAQPASGPKTTAGDCPHRRRCRAEGRLQGAWPPRGHRARLQEAGHHQNDIVW